VAERHTRGRIKKDDYIVRFDYNPLSEKENERYNRSRSRQPLKTSLSAQKLSPFAKGREAREAREGREEGVGLVDALRGLKYHPFREDNSEILKVTAMSKHLSSEINYNAKNMAYNLGGKRKDVEKVV
jgi:hypothetical protein